jgi:AraC family transcriptional activator of pobA
MPFDPTDTSPLRLQTLAQLSARGAWQIELTHDRAEALLIWITRGQGVALLDGERRGLGLHNAIFVSPRHLMSLEMGRQSFGQVLSIPPGSDLVMPETIQHLRIRDVMAQNELSGLFEQLNREQAAAQPLHQTAMAAIADLILIWLRRQMFEADGTLPEKTASQRLVRAFCARLVDQYASGQSMAQHAQALGVTPTHLTRVCRAQTSKTAATLLTERQLHAARMLLMTTDAQIRDIALHLGFGSAAYFTRFIQQHTGMTPSQLRKQTA